MTTQLGSFSGVGHRYYMTDEPSELPSDLEAAVAEVERVVGEGWRIQTIAPHPLFSVSWQYGGAEDGKTETQKRQGWEVTMAVASFARTGFVSCWGPTISQALWCVVSSFPDWETNPYDRHRDRIVTGPDGQ